MSNRQAHPSTSDGLVGGALVVVGFVVLIVVAAVDLISSRWSPSAPSSQTTQVKGNSSVTPLKKDIAPSTSDVVKVPIEEPNPRSAIETLRNTVHSDSSVITPKATDHAVQPQLGYPPIHDLDDKDVAKVEDSTAEVPLDQDRDWRQSDSHTADTHEQQIAVPVATDSSQEWVSLSTPAPESLSSIKANDPDLQQDSMPTASFVHIDQGSSSHQPESTLEFSSSTLIDAPTKLHESAMSIGSADYSSSSPPLSSPDPDTHSFDNAAVQIHTDAEKLVPLNPESSVEFGSVSEVLKPRISIPSLYESSINRGAGSISELSTKTKRGNSFIKKSSSLMNKVFKGKGTSDNVSNNNDDRTNSQPLASSFVSEHEIIANSSMTKKLTSPSRVSLGSIRSISGSIKKKIGKSSSSTTAGNTASKEPIASRPQEEESRPVTSDSYSLPSNSSQASKVADGTGPSLLKTMFKVRKPSK